MEDFGFVVGFDLGHGETALTMINLKSEHKKETAVKIKVKGESNFITTLAYHPERGILIGEPAIVTEGVTETHLAFKQRPVSDSCYQKVLADYVSHIYQEVKASGYGITNDNTLFVIGCPTDWASDKNRQLVTAYEAIIREKAMIPFVKVVAESRGALMNAIESGDLHMAELRGRALVIDLGSSTADFTLINVSQRHADPFDFGHELGASLIDKMIFRHLLFQHKRKNELIPLLTASTVHRNRCELACRKAKESWFKANDSVASVFVDIIPDELEFRGRVNTQLMEVILGSSFEELRDMEAVIGKSFAYLPQRSWEEELKWQLNQARSASEDVGELPDIVLLTGGASQMSFVEPVCQDVFPKSRIMRGPEPEYAISRGLSYWGRVDIRTQGFSRAIDKFVEDTVRPEVTQNVGAIITAIGERLSSGVVRIIKSEFDDWKTQGYATINDMKAGIDREVKSFIDTQLPKDVEACIGESIVRMSKSLEEQIKPLEKRYDIPSGLLGVSFVSSGLRKVDLRIDVPRDNDYTDGLGDALANLVGSVAGVVTAVVTYIASVQVIGIVYTLVVSISGALAVPLFTILSSNPFTVGFIGVIATAAFFAGKNINEYFKEKLPSFDIPGPARALVDSGSIHRKIDASRSDISAEIGSALAQDKDLRTIFIDKITEAFKNQLSEKADDARVLIS